MGNFDPEKDAVRGRLAELITFIAKLFDPHLVLPSEEGNAPKEARWAVRKAYLFIIGISLVLWALGYAVVYFLFDR